MTYQIRIYGQADDDQSIHNLGVATVNGDPEEWMTEVPAALRGLAEGIEQWNAQVTDSIADLLGAEEEKTDE